jgi:hypothetical protein
MRRVKTKNSKARASCGARIIEGPLLILGRASDMRAEFFSFLVQWW